MSFSTTPTEVLAHVMSFLDSASADRNVQCCNKQCSRSWRHSANLHQVVRLGESWPLNPPAFRDLFKDASHITISGKALSWYGDMYTTNLAQGLPAKRPKMIHIQQSEDLYFNDTSIFVSAVEMEKGVDYLKFILSVEYWPHPVRMHIVSDIHIAQHAIRVVKLGMLLKLAERDRNSDTTLNLHIHMSLCTGMVKELYDIAHILSDEDAIEWGRPDGGKGFNVMPQPEFRPSMCEYNACGCHRLSSHGQTRQMVIANKLMRDQMLPLKNTHLIIHTDLSIDPVPWPDVVGVSVDRIKRLFLNVTFVKIDMHTRPTFHPLHC